MERLFCKIAFVLFVLTVDGKPTLDEQSITCSAPGTVHEGDATSLTFRFGKNLGTTKQDFYVYRYCNDSEPVIVTLCEYHDDRWRCDTVDGYSVQTSRISSKVTLEISSARQNQSGHYVCKTLPATKSLPASACSLVVKAKPKITCDTEGIVTMGQSTSLTCNFESNLRNTEQDFYIYRFRDNNSEPVIIALCTWNGVNDHDCEVGDGYSLSAASISNEVVLGIPLATEEHSGKYICKTLPAEEAPLAQHCSLTVHTALQRTAALGLKRSYMPALLGLSGCLILACVVVVVLVFLRRRSKGC